MTELVRELPKQKVVLTNDISDVDIICIEFFGREKAILKKSSSGFYGALLEDESLPSKTKWFEKTKEEYVNKALGQTGAKAYRFETLKEALEFMLS